MGRQNYSKTFRRFANELSGLRGFSATNLKRMKQFYESWKDIFQISQTLSGQLEQSNNTISPTLSDQLKLQTVLHQKETTAELSPTLSDEFYNYFISLSFSNHYEIIANAKNLLPDAETLKKLMD